MLKQENNLIESTKEAFKWNLPFEENTIQMINKIKDWVDFLTLIYNNLRSIFIDENEFKYILRLIKYFKNDMETSENSFFEFTKDLALAKNKFEIYWIFKKYWFNLNLKW